MLLNYLADRIADRLHPNAEADARAAGLTVRRNPGGGWTVHDPRLAGYAEGRRRRMVRDGLDPVDRALMDPAPADLLAAEQPALGAGLLVSDGCAPQVVRALHVTDADCTRVAALRRAAA
jgi:hypothetical protein